MKATLWGNVLMKSEIWIYYYYILGWKGILAQQQGEGEQFQDETLDLPPQIQAMSK